VKSPLIEQEIPDEIGLLKIVTDILDGISGAELQAVFRTWIERTQSAQSLLTSLDPRIEFVSHFFD
jgi:hypothetical protein